MKLWNKVSIKSIRYLIVTTTLHFALIKWMLNMTFMQSILFPILTCMWRHGPYPLLARQICNNPNPKSPSLPIANYFKTFPLITSYIFISFITTVCYYILGLIYGIHWKTDHLNCTLEATTHTKIIGIQFFLVL